MAFGCRWDKCLKLQEKLLIGDVVAGAPSPEHAHLVGVQVGIELIQRLGEAFQVDQAFLTQLMVVFDELAVSGGVDSTNDVAFLVPTVIYFAIGINGQSP